MKRIISLAMLIIAFSGCMTINKQQRIAKAYMHDHPIELAKLCSIHFKPQTVYKEGEPVYLQGKTVTVVDTVQIQVDCPDGTKIDCPPGKTIYRTDTIKVTDTISVPDLAAIAVLHDKVNELDKENAVFQADNDRLKKLAGTRLWWIIGLSVGLAGTGYLLFRRGI